MSDSSPAARLISALIERADGAHAILLVGSDDSERDLMVRRLANGWMGRDVDANLETAVDLLRVVPGGASAFITLGMIVPRDYDGIPVRDFLRTVPLMAKKKVVWIQRPERMNQDAYNALLKLLEEPPPYARFVLTSTSLTGVAQTIISRCTVVACQRAADDGDWGDVERLLCEGSFERRKIFRENSESYTAMHGFLTSLGRRKPSYALRATEEFLQLAGALPGDTARERNVEALRLLGVWSSHHQWPAHVGLKIAEAHRRITGNANAGIQLDPLMVELLTAIN